MTTESLGVFLFLTDMYRVGTTTNDPRIRKRNRGRRRIRIYDAHLRASNFFAHSRTNELTNERINGRPAPWIRQKQNSYLSLVRLLQQAFVCCVRRRERWFHFDILAYYIYYMCVCVFVHISTPPTTTTTTILLLRVACFEPRKEKKRGSLLAVAAACCWCRVVCCRMSVVASSSFLSLSLLHSPVWLLTWLEKRAQKGKRLSSSSGRNCEDRSVELSFG